MKRISILISLAACLCASANAQSQYQVNPSLSQVTDKGDNASVFDVFVLDPTSIQTLTDAKKTIHNYTIDEISRHWYWWNGWTAGDGSYPGVDFHFDGYISQTVTGEGGWSGGGLAVDYDAADATKPGIDLSHITDATRLHVAFRSVNIPDAIAVILMDGAAWGSQPAKFSIGKSAFVDNGTPFPILADFDRTGGDWIGVDISFGDLKKMWPTFAPQASKTWNGNALAILSGAVAGVDFSIDAFYFYSPKDAGAVNGIVADEADFVITDNTVNLAGAEKIELFNAAGQLVKSANASVLGIDDVNAGLYIVKAGNAVKKVCIK